GTSGVKMVVVRDDLSRPAQQLEKNAFAGSALMSRENMRHARQISQHLFEAIPTPGAGIGFVSPKHAGPLFTRHGRSAAVREQIDNHFLGWDLEDIEVSLPQDDLSLGGGGQFDRLHHLDLEWFDNGIHCSTRPSAKIRISPFQDSLQAKVVTASPRF